ncbi:MAG: aldehyde dehydrogenase family protein [Candidatus Obscuribacter sp.]|nr:aldehyde dehydrogenase family protein [Candidatus Obscuribacter sp.]
MALKLAQAASTLRVGDPPDKSTDVGPLIRPDEALIGLIAGCKKLSTLAKIHCGGQKVGNTCYQPTVPLDPPLSCQSLLRRDFTRCFASIAMTISMLQSKRLSLYRYLSGSSV